MLPPSGSGPPLESMTEEEAPVTAKPPRIVFFGMRCQFSAIVLETLVAHGCVIAGVLLAGDSGEGSRGDLPLANRYARPGTVEAIAKDAGIPLRIAAVNVVDALDHWRPDAIAVACFPRRLPAKALSLPRLGALNVHPALLPRHRGPAPLFWTFHAGDRLAGVTVHLMTDRLDAGPIVAQTAVEVPFGTDGAEFEASLAVIGGNLLAEAIARRHAGDLEAVPQIEAEANSQGFPTEADVRIGTDRSGRWVFSFVRGITSLGFAATIHIETAGEQILVDHVHSYTPGARLDAPIMRNIETVSIQFLDGICEFSVKELRKTIMPVIDTGNPRVR